MTHDSNTIEQDVASKFIHKLSHDITGIAHNIVGYATLLEDELNPEYIKGINKQVTKLKDRIQQAVAAVDNGSLVNQQSS
jgi:hypothetical protein